MNHAPGAAWFVAQTQPMAEGKASANLVQQGFEVYLPRYLKTVRHARRITKVKAPLFPSYIFVKIDTARQRWRAVNSTVGVSRLVGHESGPAVLDDNVIAGLKQREGDDGLFENIAARTRFKAGDAVKVLQGVLDSERFNLLRSLEFFASFGDVELWEVVHRARWQRFAYGHPLYRVGEEGNSFHIIAQGEVEVYRDGEKVAQLGSGTSVGEMAYLAPSPELRRHSTNVIVTDPATTISFTPETLAQVSPSCRHLFDEAFIRVLVRRLHAAHEAIAHPRRIL